MGFSFRQFIAGVRLVPVTSTGVSQKGDLEVLDASGKINYYNGSSASPIVTEAHSATLTNKILSGSSNTFSNIGYSSLVLTNSILNADISSSAGIVYSKLNLVGSIVNADINASAGIVYSKLNLVGSILNADISASAAIERTKIASGTADHVLINNGSGVLSSEAALSPTRGGTGVSNNASATLTRSGNHALTLTTTNTTSLTLPTTGTLASLAGTETLSNKSFSDSVTIAEIATPSTPSSGFGRVYFKSDGKVYSLNDGGTESELLTASAAEPRNNFLYNSNFDIWQRGTSFSLFSGSGGTQYTADRWYVFRSNGTASCSRVTATTDGSKYALSVSNTSTNSSAPVTLFQTLENLDSIKLYNKTVSLSIKVKAIGNVNDVKVILGYQPSETRVNSLSSNLLSSTTSSVTTGSFTTITINNISVGTSMGASGVLGIGLGINGVSSGGIGDNGNGFIVEQIQLNIGSTAAEYQPMFKSIAEELSSCQRYYQRKTTANGVGADSSTCNVSVDLTPEMRTIPGVSASGTLQITDAVATDYNQSSAQFVGVSGETTTRGGRYALGNFSGLTAYRVYIVEPGSGNFMEFDADI